MRIAVTGFVSERSGSMASANALYLRFLLEAGHEIVFFSKASFVDPRPLARGRPGLHFVDAENRFADGLRRACERVPALGFAARLADSSSYNRLLVRRMVREHRETPFDLCLWLGDYARGRVPGVPTVSYVQGAPGSDARSILRHFGMIRRLAGFREAWKWRALSVLRLSRMGRPPFHCSDRLLVGSSQSRRALESFFGIPPEKSIALAYPIDLDLFHPSAPSRSWPELRCLWLGRIVPRKRLDLFLGAAEECLRKGIDLRVTLVGGIGLVKGFERLIRAFAFPDRLTWKKSVAREEAPGLFHSHDVLVQPSEEEDFGSSVAEAQACGLPVVIGASGGNADYLSARDICLADSGVGGLADALRGMAGEKSSWGAEQAAVSRRAAENNFCISRLGPKLEGILERCRSLRK